MSGLGLALRALWWRRGLSAAVLGVSALVVAVAVAGPTYDRAAKESVLQDSLRSAPPLETGLEVNAFSSLPRLELMVNQRVRAAGITNYEPVIGAQEAPYHGRFSCARSVKLITSACNTPARGLVVARTGFLNHVTISAGRAPRAAGEVIASAAFLKLNGLRPGDRFTPVGALPDRTYTRQISPGPVFTSLTIVGAFTTDESAGFWFQRMYFADMAAIPIRKGEAPDPYDDALFTLPSTMAPLQYEAVIDLPLDLASVRVANAATLRARVEKVQTDLANENLVGSAVSTVLPAVLTSAAANEHSLGAPILLIVLQLLLLCVMVLYGAVRAAAEARGPEVALAKLRRFRPRSVLLFGLAEPLLLVPLALPIGVGLGWLTTVLLARQQLVSGTPVLLPWEAVLAGVGAVAGAGAATMWVGIRIATRPIAAQWRRATQRPATRPWWVDLLVVAAAAGGLAWLAATGGIAVTNNESSADPRSLAGPALLALAVAMVGSRLLPWACRRLYGRTARGSVAGYLAVRQIARRPTTLSVTVLLAVALAISAFAVSAFTVARSNRHAVAAIMVGAPTVVHVTVPGDDDLGALVDAADPSGRQAMAVTESPVLAADRRELIGVEPQRLAAIATWRNDFAGGRSLTSVANALTVSGLHPVTATGTQLAVDATTSGLTGAAVIRLTVTVDRHGASYTLVGSPLAASGMTRTVVELPGCLAGCRLVSLGLRRDVFGTTDLSGTLQITGIQQRGAGTWQDVPGALAGGATGWRPVRPNAPGYTSTLTGTGDLTFAFRLPWQQAPQLATYDTPEVIPAVTTDSAALGTNVIVGGLDGQRLPVLVAVRATYLPRAQINGVLVDRTLAVRSAVETLNAQNEVWLAAGADPGILTLLQARGVVLGQRQTLAATEGALARQGPPLALALFRIGGVVAAILALGGAALTLALAARRRGFELAALLAQGASRRSLFRSLLTEQGVLLGYGTVLGVAAGIIGALVALPSVPEFVTRPLAPQLLYTPPYLQVIVIGAVLGVLVTAGLLVGSAVLVRTVSADRLREYAP